MGITFDENKDQQVNFNNMTQEKITELLEWAYISTIRGLPGQTDIYSLVNDYLSRYDNETAINKLISAQKTKATTSGIITGFGGIITMPVTVPANVASVLLVQMRMIAAIALIRGYDLNSDQVKTFIYATLAGTSVADITKKTGIIIGNKMMTGVIKKIPGKTLTRINQAVGFRLVTKFGTKGAINLGKAVPVAGAVVGGGIDLFTTTGIAKLAKRTFTDDGIDVGDGTIINKAEFEVID